MSDDDDKDNTVVPFRKNKKEKHDPVKGYLRAAQKASSRKVRSQRKEAQQQGIRLSTGISEAISQDLAKEPSKQAVKETTAFLARQPIEKLIEEASLSSIEDWKKKTVHYSALANVLSHFSLTGK